MLLKMFIGKVMLEEVELDLREYESFIDREGVVEKEVCEMVQRHRKQILLANIRPTFFLHARSKMKIDYLLPTWDELKTLYHDTETEG